LSFFWSMRYCRCSGWLLWILDKYSILDKMPLRALASVNTLLPDATHFFLLFSNSFAMRWKSRLLYSELSSNHNPLLLWLIFRTYFDHISYFGFILHFLWFFNFFLLWKINWFALVLFFLCHGELVPCHWEERFGEIKVEGFIDEKMMINDGHHMQLKIYKNQCRNHHCMLEVAIMMEHETLSVPKA